MYAFVDTVNSGIVGTNLPTEAMSYNGVYLENEIDGYRTLSVTGRELMESEVTDQEIDGMDGSYYRYKTTPARTITVKYQLRARGSREYREAYNKMNKLLSGEQVKVIFNDESDKYFIGTKTSNTQVDGGSNNVIGEIEIYCSDPRKYSTTEKEFTATDGVLNIVNEGTVPVSIDYDVQTTSETGYIGLVSEEGIMQYGKVEELDGETYKQSEWLASIKDFYNCNDDIGGTDVMHPSYGTNGTLIEHTWFGNKFIGLGSAGTKKGNANGGLRTLVLPADSSGDTSGAKNFYCWFHLCFYAGLMGQTGEMCINFLTEDDKLICGCNWYKTDSVGNTGHYEIWANGKVLKNWEFTTSHLQAQNPFYYKWGSCDILKEGANIRFFFWARYYNFYIPEIENMKCAKIQIAVKQWGDRGGNKFMSMIGFDVIDFEKMNVEKWKDIPNRYPSGTNITIDGKSSHIYVNGMARPEDEVLGTQYFKAPVGTSEVKVTCSEWTKSQPIVKAKIREAWL
ncbi:distal tail protein Dit [Holdemanella biformis]|uniref:distal tail protein Dit n=1 Tax=Holdemanella biformis TaxID=1735 RepID=UPI002670E62F|nr:distal tail protein Dit [Holdemanella biformis]